LGEGIKEAKRFFRVRVINVRNDYTSIKGNSLTAHVVLNPVTKVKDAHFIVTISK
jgi:hypothetical protein